MGAYRNGGWDSHRRESGIQPGHQFDCNASPQTLEDIELEYKKEVSELMKIRDKEEDEENVKHREVWPSLAHIFMHILSHNYYHSCTCHRAEIKKLVFDHFIC